MSQDPRPDEPVDEPLAARARTPASPHLDDRPPRRVSITVGAMTIVALGLFVARGPRRIPPPERDVSEPAPLASNAEQRLDEAIEELKSLPPLEATGPSKILEALEEIAPSNVGRKMPDGSDPPLLPKTAPKRVRFGLVLVRYKGAQLAPKNAPNREAAREHAELLARLARDDFAAAVKAADVGSTGDIGVVKRGILEPAIEYTLFTLPIGGVSDVVDTPRGFWVMKRLK
jgi:hypothetical protein